MLYFPLETAVFLQVLANSVVVLIFSVGSGIHSGAVTGPSVNKRRSVLGGCFTQTHSSR